MDDIYYVELVLKGDTNAFRFLVRQHKDMVYSVSLKILENTGKAEIVSQNTFVLAFKSLKKFRKDASFSSWLYRIAVNESLKQLNLDKHYQEKFEDILTQEIIDESILPPFHKEESKSLLEKAMALLSKDEEHVLKQFYLEEDSINDISNHTGWSISKIKVTLFRARKHMRNIMTKILDNKMAL